MRHAGLILLLPTMILAIASLAPAQTLAFRCDFDADMVGLPPALTPPGDPDGDALEISQSGGTVLVQSDLLDLDQQPLVISRQAVGSLYARFLTDPDVRDCLTYIIRWDQVLDRYAGFFYIAFHSPNSKTMGSVEFRSGGQMTANGSNHVLDATYAPGTVVSIEVRLDIADGLMDVSVNGVPDPSGQDLGPVQGGGDGLKDISTGFGLVDTYTVALDNLEIVGLNCGGVANEAVSWGELKARYR